MVKKSLLLAVQLASHLAYMILVPLMVFGGAGLLIDRHWHSLPRFLLTGVAIAFILTIYWIKARLREVIQALLKETKN